MLGAPEGHVLPVREVRLSAGAGFVVAIGGEIMTMPGLPREPAGGVDRAERGRADRGAVLSGTVRSLTPALSRKREREITRRPLSRLRERVGVRAAVQES